MIAWVQKQSMGARLCFAFAYSGAFYALLFLFEGRARDIVSLGLITAFPFFYGMAVQLVFYPVARIRFSRLGMWALAPVAGLCLILVVLEFETLICVAILLPMFVVLLALGMAIMRLMLGRNVVRGDNAKLNAAIWLAPVLALPVMGQMQFPTTQYTVTTRIEIAAPRAVVWGQTYEISPITEPERVWTVSHNLLNSPKPIDAAVTGHVRQLRWTNGVRFQEHLTHATPNTAMTWDFVFHAPETLRSFDPHIAPQGSIVFLKGGAYRLDETANGATELTLETHYTLTGPLNGYLSLWGDFFLQDFHHAVLSVIKTRSETEQRNR